MKKLIYVIATAAAFLFAGIAMAQTVTQISPFTYKSISPSVIGSQLNTSSLRMPYYATTSAVCFKPDAVGNFVLGACGTGGGGVTTTINNVQGPTFSFTTSGVGLTISTSTGVVNFNWTNPGYIVSGDVPTYETDPIYSANSYAIGMNQGVATGDTVLFDTVEANDFSATSSYAFHVSPASIFDGNFTGLAAAGFGISGGSFGGINVEDSVGNVYIGVGFDTATSTYPLTVNGDLYIIGSGTLNGNTIPAGPGTLALTSDLAPYALQSQVVSDLIAGPGISLDVTTGTVTITATGGAGVSDLVQGSNIVLDNTTGTVTVAVTSTPLFNKLTIDGATAEFVTVNASGTDHALQINNLELDSKNVHLSFANASTGYALSDGFDVGIEMDGIARLRQQENEDMEFYTNDIENMILSNTGVLTVVNLGTGLVNATAGALGIATAGVDYVSTSTGNWLGTWQGNSPSFFQTNLNGIYVATTTGNWLGTWQGNSPAAFYLASNPSNFISLGSLSGGTGISYNSGTGAITNSRPFVTSTFNGSEGITWTATGTPGQIAADVSGAATTFRLQMAGITCGGTDKVSYISPTGTAICTADQSGTGSFTTTTINGLSTTEYTLSSANALLNIATSAPGTITLTVTTTPSFSSVTIPGIVSSFLATDGNGTLIATTTPAGSPGTNYFQLASGVLSGTSTAYKFAVGTSTCDEAACIQGIATADILDVYTSSSLLAFRVDKNGNVNIGSSTALLATVNTPLAIDVDKIGYNQIIYRNRNSAATSTVGYQLRNASSSDEIYAEVGLNSPRYSDPLFPTERANSLYLLNIQNGTTAGDIDLISSSTNGQIKLLTGGTTSSKIRVTVDSTGNVGVGTTTPAEMLTVAGNVRIASTTGGLIFQDGTKMITAPIITTSSDVYVITTVNSSSTNSTSSQNIIGMTWAMASSTRYDISCDFEYDSSAATIGLGIGWSFAYNLVYGSGHMMAPIGPATGGMVPSTKSSSTFVTSATNFTSASYSTASNHAIFQGHMLVGGLSDTMQMKFKPETATAGGTVIKPGSWCKYHTY